MLYEGRTHVYFHSPLYPHCLAQGLTSENIYGKNKWMRGSSLISKVPPDPKILSYYKSNQWRLPAQLDYTLCHWTCCLFRAQRLLPFYSYLLSIVTISLVQMKFGHSTGKMGGSHQTTNKIYSLEIKSLIT